MQRCREPGVPRQRASRNQATVARSPSGSGVGRILGEQRAESGLVGLRVMHVAGAGSSVVAVEPVATTTSNSCDHLQQGRPEPKARLTGSGSVTWRRMASVSTSTTVSTKVKSRVWVPSPWTGSGLPVRAHDDEGRHHCRVGVSGRLQGTEHVEETESQHRKPERSAVGEGVRLGGQLAGGIGADREGHHVFSLWEAWVGAVHRRRGCHDDVGHAVPPGRFQHRHGSGGVDLVGGHGIGQRAWAPRGGRPGGRWPRAPSMTPSRSVGLRMVPSRSSTEGEPARFWREPVDRSSSATTWSTRPGGRASGTGSRR